MRRGAGAGLGILGTIINTIARVIAAIIVIGILLFVFEANPSNGIVELINDIAEFFVGPFDDLFTPKDEKVARAINWGIAALVYLIVGGVIAALLHRSGRAATPTREV